MTDDADLLRLRATDAEDLAVISSVLQDAIVPLQDMGFDSVESRFFMVASRFCWDKQAEICAADEEGPECAVYDRILCALEISGVVAVECHEWPCLPCDKDPCNGLLELLAISLKDNVLIAYFAGGPQLRLHVKDWTLHVADYGEPWPTGCLPHHEMG